MFHIGDIVQVQGDSWFAGATGWITDIVPDVETLMIELDEYGRKVPKGLILPFAPSEVAIYEKPQA